MKEKKTLAVFDFDGTITNRDSFILFLKYLKPGLSFYLNMWLSVPELILYFSGYFSKKQIKEKLLKNFCGAISQKQFDDYCYQFSKNILPSIIKPSAIREIEKLKEQNAHIVLLTASPENYLIPLCKQYKITLIGSRLKKCSLHFVPEMIGENCFGAEKVKRLEEQINLSEYDVRIGYGDTYGDKPFLKLMTEVHYKPFRN